MLLALTVLVAGCAGDNGESPDSGDGAQDAPTGCQSRAGQTQNQSGAQIACANVRGANTTEQPFDCPDPSRSAVGVAWNMTSGSLTVRVADAGGATLFEETYQETGTGNDSARINEGEAGEWTLVAERDASFDGSLRAQAVCAVPDGSQQSSGPGGPSMTGADLRVDDAEGILVPDAP